MSTNSLKKVSLAIPRTSIAAATGVLAQKADTALGQLAGELVTGIKSDSAEKRTKSWQSAGQVGAPAVKPLAAVMTDDDLEVARAAKRALWQIVRYTGRPGANQEKKAVEAELIELLGDETPVAVRREDFGELSRAVLWMLSEIGSRRCIDPIAGLMKNEALREDARMALERIPNRRAIAALKATLDKAPEEFKPNLAQSLRKRGEEVAGYPCKKLVPTKKTDVKPL
jgi:HEAT repeat protein